jgi:hypothetical protein
VAPVHPGPCRRVLHRHEPSAAHVAAAGLPQEATPAAPGREPRAIGDDPAVAAGRGVPQAGGVPDRVGARNRQAAFAQEGVRRDAAGGGGLVERLADAPRILRGRIVDDALGPGLTSP